MTHILAKIAIYEMWVDVKNNHGMVRGIKNGITLVIGNIWYQIPNISLKPSNCAQNKNRTCTPLREHGPQPCASTISAIWA